MFEGYLFLAAFANQTIAHLGQFQPSMSSASRRPHIIVIGCFRGAFLLATEHRLLAPVETVSNMVLVGQNLGSDHAQNSHRFQEPCTWRWHSYSGTPNCCCYHFEYARIYASMILDIIRLAHNLRPARFPRLSRFSCC